MSFFIYFGKWKKRQPNLPLWLRGKKKPSWFPYPALFVESRTITNLTGMKMNAPKKLKNYHENDVIFFFWFGITGVCVFIPRRNSTVKIQLNCCFVFSFFWFVILHFFGFLLSSGNWQSEKKRKNVPCSMCECMTEWRVPQSINDDGCRRYLKLKKLESKVIHVVGNFQFPLPPPAAAAHQLTNKQKQI